MTFVTKSGGLPGYASRIFMMPEHGLGLTVLVACGPECGDLLTLIQEIVTVELIQDAEELIWKDIGLSYSGHYSAVDPALNSSLTLSCSPATGFTVDSFISNGTDVISALVVGLGFVDNTRPWRLQLLPTLLYQNESAQQGEIWRLIAAYERDEGKGVWDGFCTTDIDAAVYGGLPLNGIVFWHDEGVVEMPAWSVKMKASKNQDGSGGIVIQN